MAENARWEIKISATDDTSAAFNSVQQRMKQAQSIMDGVVKTAEAFKTAAAGFAALETVNKFLDTAKAAAEVERLGKSLGFTSDQIEAMQKSAAETGQTFDQQAEYFKNNRSQLDQMTDAYRKQGQLMSGPLRSAFADVNEQLDVFMRTISTVRHQFEGGTIDKAVGTIANMIRDMGASLAYFEVYKGTITSIRELLAMFTGAGGMVGGGAENRAAAMIDQLRANSVDATKELQKAQSELKALEEAPPKRNVFKEQSAFPGTGALEVQRRKVEELQTLADIAAKKVQDAEAAFNKGKAVIETAKESPAIKVPELPKYLPAGSMAGEDSAEKKLAILIAERAALERATASFNQAFDVRGTETVDQVDKRLQRSVDLEKQIATLTKNVGRESPLGQQLADEATKLSEAQAKWEIYHRVVNGADATIKQYGDGSRELKRALKELDEQLAAGKITQEEYNYALKDAKMNTDAQAIASRGAAGGLSGFFAGMENASRNANKMSREFQYGEKAIALMDDAISQLVSNGEINFQKLLQSFITMLIQMEMRAAASSLFSAIGGGGSAAGMGGLLSGLVSGVGSLFGPSLNTLQGGIGPGGQVLLFADGGRPPPNRPSIVGERGPELFVPDTAGTIVPNEALGGGSGEVVSISMTNSFGGGVTHAEMLRYGAMIEERAKAGAMAGIEAKRKRGGAIKQVFRG